MAIDVYVNNILHGPLALVVLIVLSIIFSDLALFIIVGINLNHGKISLMYIHVTLSL